MARTKGSIDRKRRVYIGPPCPAYMVALEDRYSTIRAERLMVEGCMRHEPSNDGRGMVARAASSVSATTISASERARVRDSHDGRSASERSSARPYAHATFLKDVARGKSPRRLCGDPVTFTAPAWLVSLVYAAELTSEGVTRALAPFERVPFDDTPADTREGRKVARVASVQEQRAASHRAIAGTIRMADID